MFISLSYITTAQKLNSLLSFCIKLNDRINIVSTADCYREKTMQPNAEGMAVSWSFNFKHGYMTIFNSFKTREAQCRVLFSLFFVIQLW